MKTYVALTKNIKKKYELTKSFFTRQLALCYTRLAGFIPNASIGIMFSSANSSSCPALDCWGFLFFSWIWNLTLGSRAVAFNTYNASFTSFRFRLIFIATAVSVHTKACIVNEMKCQVFVTKTYVALTKNIQKI